MEEPKEIGNNWRNPDGTLKEGHPPLEGVGRPKGSVSITEAIKKKLEEVPEGQKKTYLEAFVIKLFKKAINDEDVGAIRLIINYVDGLPIQPVKFDGRMKLTIGEILNELESENYGSKTQEQGLENQSFISDH